jgi:S1-C subfamily serine protease
LRVFYPDDGGVRGRAAMLIAEDAFHDVAILRMVGTPLPSLDLAPDTQGDPPQGRGIALMGYPLGFRLGLVPTVHKGVVAAVVPAVQPLPAGAKLTPELVEAIDKPFKLYQLDIVAFPGNSGSPLFDARNGQVLGIINKVLGNKTREHLIENPSGISYAVPARWIHEAVIRAAISAEEKRNATLRDGFR